MHKLRNAIAIILLLLIAGPIWAAALLPNGEQTFVDENGVPYAGGKVYFYIPNTTTPKTTWSDPTEVNPNSNPVILDSAGRAIIYGSGQYRQILKDANDVTIWDQLTDTPGNTITAGDSSITISPSSCTSGDSCTIIVATNGVTNAKLAQMPANTIKGNNTDSTANAMDLTVSQIQGMLGSTEGYIYGLTLSNDSVDATNDIDIAAGRATDNQSGIVMVLATALIKQLDAAWAVGTNQGCLDTGTVGNNTYHLFLIQRSDTEVEDVLCSLSATSPTMPANYDRKRRIGSIVRSAGAILPFVQHGNYFDWASPVNDLNVTSTGTTAVTRTLTLPVGIKIRARFTFDIDDAGTSNVIFAYASSLDQTDVAASTSAFNLFIGLGSATRNNSSELNVWTNTSAQIRTRASASAPGIAQRITTLGWMDMRGQDGSP